MAQLGTYPASVVRMGIVMAGFLALTACANPRSEAAARAETGLIGVPKEMLYSCAGVPDRVQQIGDAEQITYARGTTLTQVETDYDDFGFGGRRFFRPRTTVHRQHFRCEATFTLRNGLVESLEYNRDRDLELCGTIVETCMAVVPTPR